MKYPTSTSSGEIGKILHIILEKIIPYKKNGFFIEIGANDGKVGSFTYNLAKLGWSGMNFEPIPSLYEKCCQNHRNHNVKNFNIALGSEVSTMEIIEADTLSTLDNTSLEVYKKSPEFKNHFNNNKKHTVKIETLDNFIEKYEIKNIDLLVLDVEGFEEEVLKGYTRIKSVKPIIFIIEIADQHVYLSQDTDMKNKYKKLRNFFKNNGDYELLVNDVVDNIYVRKDIFFSIDEEFINKIKSMIKYPQYSD